jgi:23S rRNA pseudouridine1911/1915/1917 synthase
MTSRVIVVPDGLEGVRLDIALSRMLGFSRTAAAALIDSGSVLINGIVQPKSALVSAAEVLDVAFPEPQRQLDTEPMFAEGMTLLHDDDHVVVVNKPAGVAAHPSVGWTGPTVVQGLAALGYRVSTSGAPERQGIVQRLDVGTTGVMVVAKSEMAYSLLKRAFKQRSVDKRYLALVQGHPDPSRGTIDAPIARHPSSDWKFAVMANGRASITHYETVEAFRSASLLDIHLETGRTHQIRVHMSAVKHPCVGDLTYGADPVMAKRLRLERQWLHAQTLGFMHPSTGDWVEFEAPLPDDLQRALDALRDH